MREKPDPSGDHQSSVMTLPRTHGVPSCLNLRVRWTGHLEHGCRTRPTGWSPQVRAAVRTAWSRVGLGLGSMASFPGLPGTGALSRTSRADAGEVPDKLGRMVTSSGPALSGHRGHRSSDLLPGNQLGVISRADRRGRGGKRSELIYVLDSGRSQWGWGRDW